MSTPHPARRLLWRAAIPIVVIFTLLGSTPSSGASGTGIVDGAAKAPITQDGDVAGAPTDYVLTLDISLDPTVPGRTLLAGKTIKVTLPDEFVNLGGPVTNPGPPPGCPAATGTCSTGVMLQGWPQHPIPPSPANYTVSLEGTNTIVYTATTDLVPNPPLEPGIKQVHVILRAFVNPGPGIYQFLVEAETGPGGSLETGVANVRVRNKVRASVNVTSVFNPGTPNTIYQQTTVGSPTPLAYDLLLWDKNGLPAVGTEIQMVNRTRARLIQNGRTIGQVAIKAPPGARGQQIESAGPATELLAPVLSLPSARLTAQFTAGDTPGVYRITFHMMNGTSTKMFVIVT